MSDATPRLVSIQLPADNAVSADVATQIKAEFSLPVAAGAGHVTLRSYNDDAVAMQIDIASDLVEIDGTRLTVTLPGALEQGTHYYVAIDRGALVRAQSEAEAALLFSEDFESLAEALGPYASPTEGGGDGTDWTAVLPGGWSQDNRSLPGGPAEFYGWTFHDLGSWIATAGDQDRSQFAAASGVVAVADGDEYDDGDISLGTDGFNAELFMPAIDVSGIGDGRIVLEFASSWRPEDAQEAHVRASFDGGAPVSLLHYSSDEESADYKPDATSETVRLDLAVPEGASQLVFSFDMPAAGNDWWWAIDNVRVLSYPVAEADKFPGLSDKDAWDFTTWAEDELSNLFAEDWQGVTLGGFRSPTEMRGDGSDWAASAEGWSVVTDIPAGGAAEFAGWTFLDASSWSRTAWDQLRSDFADGHGIVAVADPDEYFDGAASPADGRYASTLLSPDIDVSGVASGRLRLSFDSSWRPAGGKQAQVTVAFDGGAAQVLDVWSSDPESADFRNTATDEQVLHYIDLPVGAATAQIGFALAEAGNDWWWAIDNVSLDEVVLNAAPEAAKDAAEAGSRSSVRLDLLANDAEPNGDAMALTGIDTSGMRGTVTRNADGTVTWDSAGAFAWLAEGETAETRFGYTVSDASGLSATATATVTVTGQAGRCRRSGWRHRPGRSRGRRRRARRQACRLPSRRSSGWRCPWSRRSLPGLRIPSCGWRSWHRRRRGWRGSGARWTRRRPTCRPRTSAPRTASACCPPRWHNRRGSRPRRG